MSSQRSLTLYSVCSTGTILGLINVTGKLIVHTFFVATLSTSFFFISAQYSPTFLLSPDLKFQISTIFRRYAGPTE
jgi:hypothetical protein